MGKTPVGKVKRVEVCNDTLGAGPQECPEHTRKLDKDSTTLSALLSPSP